MFNLITYLKILSLSFVRSEIYLYICINNIVKHYYLYM